MTAQRSWYERLVHRGASYLPPPVTRVEHRSVEQAFGGVIPEVVTAVRHGVRGRPPGFHIAAALLAALVPVVVIAPVIAAGFGPVDDHEIFAIASGRLTLDAALLEPYRFRPLYYVLRFGEAAVWGANPTGWLLDRALLAALTILLASWVFRWAPIAALAGALVVAGPQAEAFYRLGPQEAYATAMLLGAVALVLHDRVGIGLTLAVLAAYTKEPFVVAAAAVVALAWWRGARWPAVFATVPILAAGVAVALAAMRAPVVPLDSAIPGRYLLPAILLPIAALAWLSTRYPRPGRVIAAMCLGVGVAMSVQGASRWAEQNRAWAAFVASVPEARPLLVHAAAANYERVFALRDYVSGELVLDVTPGSGFLWQRLSDPAVQARAGYTTATPNAEVWLR